MKSDHRLLRGVGAQFLMGGMLGALFVGVIILTDLQHIRAAIASSEFPLATLVILLAGPILYFGFGAAITGFLFLVTDEIPDPEDRAS